MRRVLIEELIKEILGPRNGSEEEIHWNPYKEYITGVVEPVKCKKKEDPDPDSDNVTLYGEDFVAEDDVAEDLVPVIAPTELDPKTRPKSFGISFLINGSEPELSICVTWGRYKKIQLGDSRIIWKRFPYRKIVTFRLDRDYFKFTVYEGEDGKVFLLVRKVSQNYNLQNVVITLVNDLVPENCFEEGITEACIFQPSIRVKLLGNTRLAEPEAGDDLMLFLYRKRPVLARGYMCSAIWKDVEYQEYFDKNVMWPDGIHFENCADFFDCDVRSEFVPLYPSPAPVFEWDEEIEREFGEPPEFSAYRLSEMWDEEEIDKFLMPLAEAYRRWIQKNESTLNSESLTKSLKQLGFHLIQYQKELLRRIENGIKLLKSDKEARFAFCFANRVMWLQHKWKGRGDLTWWPFQLAFILMVLESLANPESEDREKTDLLWIPTGGGKTEAYLALMAFVMALRRVRARKGKASDSTGGGTAVITRYTLRLLTIQQFRRVLQMVTAAEFLRVMKTEKGRGWRPEKCEMDEDFILGSTRFSAGLWVGGAVTPNHLRKEGYAIDALMGGNSESEPAQVIRCPACGAYLSVPSSGLPAGEKLYLLIRSSKTEEEIRSSILSFTETSELIRNFWIHNGGESFTLEIELDKKMTENEVDDLWQNLEKELSAELLSFRASRPGYFGCRSEAGRKSNIPRDFEIYCPNPHCTLNKDVEHVEGVPLNPSGKGEELPDGLVTKEPEHLFSGSRVPIPAFTVDEQIYHRCPTIIVSTADKIARMAFEPRAASIFGIVEKYNAYYGYYRDNLLPAATTKTAKNESNSVNVTPFSPPELIVQDELHLIEGPLGSLFGLYETVVEGLQSISEAKPKYIASTATIKDAELQVRQLFARDLFQFPAYGMDIEDSFFVRYPSWDAGWVENRPGRVYMGIYCPGMGPLTPQIRIWARLLKTCYDHRENPAIRYFWTIVEYFNAVRELGGGRALYREDTVERLKQISQGDMRPIDPENVVELSSRISSTEIPVILDELEGAGRRPLSENPDAIFTTSMFGTGVDVPHLSLMIVNGQPKTTSQYVQATGRVGRAHGALVVTFLRAGRPRDLSHYEMFTGYHHRIHLEVEPSSVSPFSKGCLARASGPALVSFLRNFPSPCVDWFDENGGKEILRSEADNDIKEFFDIAISRLLRTIGDHSRITEIESYLRSQVDRWKYVAAKIRDVLKFVEYHPYRQPRFSVVLGDPQHEKSPSVEVVYRNAPQSLREIEETTGFEV